MEAEGDGSNRRRSFGIRSIIGDFGEGPAYAEQLRVLRALGAKPRDMEAVERAAQAVVR